MLAPVDPWSTLDGRLNAPGGAPQLPALLNGYPTAAPPNQRVRYPSVGTQPPWMVAGVDYRVGIPQGTTLIDWQTIDSSSGSNPIPGVSVSGHNIGVADGTTIDGVDFSLHDGAFLNASGVNGLAVRRSKFGWGLNFMPSSSPGSTMFNISGSSIIFEYNECYGNASLFTSTVTATGTIASGNTVFSSIFPIPSWFTTSPAAIDISIYNKTTAQYILNGPNGDNSSSLTSFTGTSATFANASINAITSGDVLVISAMAHQTALLSGQFGGGIQGAFTNRYNYFTDFNQHIAEIASSAAANMRWTWKYNLAVDGGTGQVGAHLNYLQWGGIDVDNASCVVEFNTGYQSQEQNSGGEGYQGYCNSGTAEPGGSFGYNTGIFSPLGSGIPHLVGGKNWRVHDNFEDKKGNTSYFYTETLPSVTGNTYTNNVDLVDGRVFGLS